VLSLAEGEAIAMSSLTGPEASTLCARFGRANWPQSTEKRRCAAHPGIDAHAAT
jgi:hypothetical protein